jgi:hypothetical protein
MAASHQTVRLSRGKHQGAEHGACVMELASMLAGERFTDRPGAVCPVVASFLRSYNDAVDDERRQDLYAYAALAVGTLADPQTQARRIARCLAFAEKLHRERASRGRRWPRKAPTPDARLGVEAPGALAAQLAARATRQDPAVHPAALAFVAELVALGSARSAEPARVAPPAAVAVTA